MKICVMGTGGLGGFFGAWLADGGEDVSFVGRGAHLQAMQSSGLEVRSALGDKLIRPVNATDDPATVGPVDVVLFGVKSYDLEAAAEQCRPLLQDSTVVISLLNGVEAVERLGHVLGEQHVVAGVTPVSSNIASPGVIDHKGSATTLIVGEADGRESERLVAFCDVCRNSGIDAQIVDDIEVVLWTKFVAFAAGGGVGTLSRQPFGVLLQVAELKALFTAAMAEVVSIARAKRVALPENVVEILLSVTDDLPPAGKVSTLLDLKNGKRLELEAGVGSVVCQGDELGVDTPICRTIYAALKPFIDGR
jgi:2-dehydropantoate 2-reductase